MLLSTKKVNFASEAALPQAAGGRAGGTMLSPGDISDGREQSSDHNLLLQKRQPLTALAEEVCANHRQLSEVLPLYLARADSSGDNWVSCSLLQSDAPASSLQQSCCCPCLPLYLTISPLAYLHGYLLSL